MPKQPESGSACFPPTCVLTLPRSIVQPLLSFAYRLFVLAALQEHEESLRTFPCTYRTLTSCICWMVRGTVCWGWVPVHGRILRFLPTRVPVHGCILRFLPTRVCLSMLACSAV